VFQAFSTGDLWPGDFGGQTTPDRKLAAAASQQGSPSSLGRRTCQKGLQTAWKADDETTTTCCMT
jgi:hypothetical protein